MEYKLEQLVKGTRIISGREAKDRRRLLDKLRWSAETFGCDEIILPSLEKTEIYTDKAGKEVLGQMYNFPDKKGRDLCLRPEGTATIQLLGDKQFKYTKDVKLWYFERCWRYEKPQAGRYREFFQFGVEWINPTDIEKARKELIMLAKHMVNVKTSEYEVNSSAKRGLAYYEGDGFEISVPSLGAQKQVVGGGAYKQGIGFAIGFDRLMLVE